MARIFGSVIPVGMVNPANERSLPGISCPMSRDAAVGHGMTVRCPDRASSSAAPGSLAEGPGGRRVRALASGPGTRAGAQPGCCSAASGGQQRAGPGADCLGGLPLRGGQRGQSSREDPVLLLEDVLAQHRQRRDEPGRPSGVGSDAG